MTELLVCIAIGIVIGWMDKLSIRARKYLDKLSLLSLFVMLFCLGAKIGCDRALLKKLDVIGLTSIELTVFVILGSVLGVFVVVKIFSFVGIGDIQEEEQEVVGKKEKGAL